MSMVDISHLTFAYEGSYDPIFEDVSFRFDTGWKLGFTGRNGRGKTTFLNLLLGRYPYEGRITHSVAFDYFPFAVPDPDAVTQDIFAAICPEAPLWQVQRELSLLELDEGALYRPFSTLSNGEQTKALLAALFLKEGNFLLIDEPTNHLDAHGRALVAAYLRRKGGFLLVSHDRQFLDACIDHLLCINKTSIEVYNGNFSTWAENKAREDAAQQSENDKLKKEIGRLEKTAREKADWSAKVEKTKLATRNAGLRPDRGHIGHMAAKMMKRSKVMEARQQAAIEQKSTLLQNIEYAEALKLHPLPCRAAPLLRLRDVQICYDGAPIHPPLRFEVSPGDRIALCGKNGCGKTSLLRLLCGQELAYRGEVQRMSGLKISYLPQDTGFLRGDLREFARQSGIDESLFKTILRKLDFSRVQFEKDMAEYSGGQKKKVLLAKSLCEEAHLYIWDEPLNYIDVLSRIQIEDILLDCKPTLLFVEHDAAFCARIATKTVEF